MSLPYDLITLWFHHKNGNLQNRQQLLVPRRSPYGFPYISFTTGFWISNTDEPSIILIITCNFFDFSWMCGPKWNAFNHHRLFHWLSTTNIVNWHFEMIVFRNNGVFQEKTWPLLSPHWSRDAAKMAFGKISLPTLRKSLMKKRESSVCRNSLERF